MVKFIASAVVNGNEVQLVKESGWYYINWGDSTQVGKTKTRIETSTGNKPSLEQVNKQFLEACKAAKYIKFSKL
jgi:hypothetical protein